MKIYHLATLHSTLPTNFSSFLTLIMHSVSLNRSWYEIINTNTTLKLPLWYRLQVRNDIHISDPFQTQENAQTPLCKNILTWPSFFYGICETVPGFWKATSCNLASTWNLDHHLPTLSFEDLSLPLKFNLVTWPSL
jgi:hypothetical protein